MSRKHEAHITTFQDSSWRGAGFSNPHPLYVDSESLSITKDIKNLQNLTRDGRVSHVESQVGGPEKPAGNLTFQPRSDDVGAILFSHFQMGTRTGTGPYTYTYVPSKGNPTYGNNSLRPEGGYGESTGDVYSVSFLKKYFDTSENNGTNSLFFEHGICDSMEFNISSGEDFILGCDYRFRDVVVGTAWAGNPGDSTNGTYSTEKPWQWFEGTILVGGESLELDSIVWTGRNTLTEKSIMGRRDPDWFAFGDYITEGEFTMDFPKDGLLHVGSMIGTKPFAIVGTLFKSGTESLSFNMPNCVRRPFEVLVDGDSVDSAIPFLALEKDGTSPITVTLITMAEIETPSDLFWDAGTSPTSLTRTLGDYILVDGGTSPTSLTRTLGDYTLADRDL